MLRSESVRRCVIWEHVNAVAEKMLDNCERTTACTTPSFCMVTCNRYLQVKLISTLWFLVMDLHQWRSHYKKYWNIYLDIKIFTIIIIFFRHVTNVTNFTSSYKISPIIFTITIIFCRHVINVTSRDMLQTLHHVTRSPPYWAVERLSTQ